MNICFMCCAVFSRSVVSDSLTPRTVACQAPLSVGILQATHMPSSRGFSHPREQTHFGTNDSESE